MLQNPVLRCLFISGDELFGETCNPKLIENAPFYVMEAKVSIKLFILKVH